MSPIPTVYQATGHIGRAVRSRNTRAEAEARQVLRAAKIKAAIEKNLADAPPLTPAQIDELRTLLATGRAK